MEQKRIYGYNYKVFWDSRKDLYEARALGINLPDIQATSKELAIIQMEAQIKTYRAEVDKDILPLLKSHNPPTLAEIGIAAKGRGLTAASQFWDFVDRVQGLWKEARSFEADWDLP